MTGSRNIVDEITGGRRMRRNRKADWTRRLVQENRLTVDDLIWPVFVVPGTNVVDPVAAMPGVNRMSIDKLVEAAKEAADLGIPALATFPNVEMSLRDETGSHCLAADNLINEATRAIKKAVPNIGVITDVALDPFTNHGHDGVLRGEVIVNDETVELVARAAVIQADAGSDIIAPSEMMDGRIGAIRQALDASGHQNVGIMSYATKFASAFYGPYRDAIGTGGLLKGDKKTYYIDPANGTEAMRDAALDVEEGADMLMVKPGLPYLDICWRMKEAFGLPVFAYQVSGEYSQIKAAAMNGWIDGERVMLETLLAFKRAGCDGILSYFAMDVARLLTKRVTGSPAFHPCSLGPWIGNHIAGKRNIIWCTPEGEAAKEPYFFASPGVEVSADICASPVPDRPYYCNPTFAWVLLNTASRG